MSARSANRTFGKRAQNHVLILASGDKVRHMTVRPWMAAIAISAVGVFGIGYLAATSYLVLRDDLIGGTIARQARMQHEYEDRITALRAQVDRVTSRQLLDQQVVEEKVEKLLQQQQALSSRNGKLGALIERAENSGLSTDFTQPAPVEPLAYEKRADATGGVKAIEKLMGLSGAQSAAPARVASLAYARPVASESTSDRADRLFSKVTLSLKDVERDQMERLEQLTDGAAKTSEAIRKIVGRTGVALPENDVAELAPSDEATDWRNRRSAVHLSSPSVTMVSVSRWQRSIRRSSSLNGRALRFASCPSTTRRRQATSPAISATASTRFSAIGTACGH